MNAYNPGTVSELKVDGKPSIFVVDVLPEQMPQSAAEPVQRPPEPQHGAFYDPANDGDDDVTLNLSERDMRKLVNDGLERMQANQKALNLLFGHVRNTVGRLDLAETWEAVDKDKALSEQIDDAVRNAKKHVNIARTNAVAVMRESSGSPMALSQDDKAAAAAIAPLIERSVDRGRLSDIRDELRAAIRADDIPTMYLYALMLPDRLNQPSRANADGTASRDMGDKRLIGELNGMLATVKDKLRDGSANELRDHASKLQAAVAAVESLANTRRVAVEGYAFTRRTDGQREVRRAGF